MQNLTTTTIHLPPSSMFESLDYLANKAEELEKMLVKFDNPEKYPDAISRKLVFVGNSFLDDIALHANESIEKIKEFAAPYFHTFKYEILRDDLRSSSDNSKVFTIDDPVIGHEYNNTWLWDKTVYQRCYRACNKVSPIDGKQMKENPEVHPVAEAFIKWMATLNPSSYVETSAMAQPPTETDLLVEKVAFQRLGTLANIYRMMKEDAEDTDIVCAEADASQKQAMELLMQVRARAEQERKALIDEKEALKAQYAASLQQIDEQVTANNARIQAQIEQQQSEILEEQAISQALADNLKKHQKKLEEEQRLTKEALQKDKENLEKNLAAKTKEFDEKLAANEQNLQIRIAEMQRGHAQAVNAGTAMLGSLEAKIESLKLQLAQQTRTSMRQEGMMAGLKAHVAKQENELAAVRSEAANNGGGGGLNCSLM